MLTNKMPMFKYADRTDDEVEDNDLIDDEDDDIEDEDEDEEDEVEPELDDD